MALQAGKRLIPELFAPAASLTSSWVSAAARVPQADGQAFTSKEVMGTGIDHLQALHSGSMHRDAEQAPSSSSLSIPSILKQHPSLLLQSAGQRRLPAGLLFPQGLASSVRSFSHLALPTQPLGLGPSRIYRINSPGVRQPMLSLNSSRSYMTEGQLLGHAYLLATDIMFWTGLIGAVVFRRNLIVMLLATEIVMLACNLNFLFGSAYLNDMTGVIMSLTITTIAACETAIGLALCVTYFHMRSATDVEALNFLK